MITILLVHVRGGRDRRTGGYYNFQTQQAGAILPICGVQQTKQVVPGDLMLEWLLSPWGAASGEQLTGEQLTGEQPLGSSRPASHWGVADPWIDCC